MGPDAMILVFWILSFKPMFHSPLSLSSRGSLVFLRFLPSEWCHLHIWGYWYFSQQILIPACASSSPAFLMMYSAYKLNKQGDNIQTWCTHFPIWNQSVIPCPVLTVAFWLAYRFLRRQVWYSHLIKNIPHFVVIYTVKGFRVVNEAEVHVLCVVCFFFF